MSEHATPAAEPTIDVTIQPDGSIAIHRLTPEMLALACAVCPDDAELAERTRLLEESPAP